MAACETAKPDKPTEWRIDMKLLGLLTTLLFLPGTLVLNHLRISVDEDGGIIRSFINSSFWGAVVLGVALKYWI